MARFVKVCSSMFIRRRIAAVRFSTNLTSAQVHPAIASFHTLLTNLLLGLANSGNGIKMTTGNGLHDGYLVIDPKDTGLARLKQIE